MNRRNGERSPLCFYYTIVLALCTLFLVLSGAAVTSSHGAPSAADRAVSSEQTEASFPVPAGACFAFIHPIGGRVLGALTLGLVAWLFIVKEEIWLRRLSLLAFVLVLLNWAVGETMLAGEKTGRPASQAIGVMHASLAPVLFSTVFVLCLLASSRWKKGPEPVHDRPGSWLSLLVLLVPLGVMLQIAFGALYRHQVFGVMEHMAGAAIVTGLALILSLQVMQKFRKRVFLAVWQ